MYKVGIIGYGKMGKIRHRAVADNGKAKVVAVFDTVETDAGVPMAAGTEDIISDPAIDAVFICTPNYLNKSLTVKSLEAGKHVFCEKPPAFNAAEVAEIQAAEKASNKILMYGFNHRHHESIQYMKKLIYG